MKSSQIYKSAAGEKLIMDVYDKTLAKWPVPCETFYAATRYGDTFIIASGEKTAKPLILLHGLNSNALAWTRDIRKYSQYFHTYAIDIIGEPGKSADNRLHWDGPAYCEWMEDVLDALNIKKSAIAGMSYGGWTALKFATYSPERVEKLALIAPGGIVPIKSSYISRAMFLSLMGNWGARQLNRILLGNQPINQDLLNYMDLIATHFKTRSTQMTIFTDKELERLTMPTLLLGGLKDPIQDMKRVAIRMKKLFRDIEVEVYPDQGHVLLNSSPAIITFLTSR